MLVLDPNYNRNNTAGRAPSSTQLPPNLNLPGAQQRLPQQGFPAYNPGKPAPQFNPAMVGTSIYHAGYGNTGGGKPAPNMQPQPNMVGQQQPMYPTQQQYQQQSPYQQFNPQSIAAIYQQRMMDNNPYSQMQQRPSLFGNMYQGTQQQEQQQMLANQAAGRPTMGTSMPYQQQFNPMMQQIRNPSAANFNPYQQLGKPTMFGTTMQNPIMQAPWFQQAQRQPLMPGQYGYGNGIV